jgi:1,5-anhydro-D-fructose reductase (1,5-anhydro-D-mannitol-forming)
MADTVGVGFIGCGNIAQLHTASLARIAADGVAIRAVAASDPSPQARAAASRNWPFERLHDDAAAVLADPEVDAVFICTPTALHRDLYLAALAAGKHLYAEKPIAPTFDIVQELCAAASAAPVTTQVGFQMRYHALLARVQAIAAANELGPPMAYLLRDDEAFPTTDLDANNSDWRSQAKFSGGGPLIEHTIHGIDILTWLFGPAARVAATTRRTLGYDVEDTAALMLEHDSGVTGTIVTIYGGVKGREESRLEVFFRSGIVEITWGVLVDAPEASMRIQRSGEPAQIIDPAEVLADHLVALSVTRRPFFWNELASRAFFDAIRSQTPASPGFVDALIAHATVEAAYRSAKTG